MYVRCVVLYSSYCILTCLHTFLLLQKFRKEDKQRSGTDAYARRSAALQRVNTHFIFTWLVS